MYLNYSRGLRFDETPDYLYLRQLFRILFRTMNHNYDYVFDWSLTKLPSSQHGPLWHEATENEDRHKGGNDSKKAWYDQRDE